MKNRTEIFKTIFGSHLYGLNTAESDTDYKSVYVPSLEEILLHGPISHSNTTTGQSNSRNTSTDVDTECFSLGRFVQLACKGEMIAIDCLYSNEQSTLVATEDWKYLQRNRNLFITKQMQSYIKYIRKQVAKYNFKGSRLNALIRVRDELLSVEKSTGNALVDMHLKDMRLYELYPILPVDNEFLHFETTEDSNKKMSNAYVVLGSKFMPMSWASELLVSVEKRIAEYGGRAEKARNNEGVDWKAVSHAFRACYQMQDLLKNGEIVFPFVGERRNALMNVKLGFYPYEYANSHLEGEYDKVLELWNSASIPEKPDMNKIEDVLLNIYTAVHT